MSSNGTRSIGPDICLYILAVFLPPVPVFLKVGFGADFWINIVLTLIGWLPGILHSWYVIYSGKGAFGNLDTSGRRHDA